MRIVQAHSVYRSKKLRDEQNAKFEQAVSPVPDPNDWFHARIEVKAEWIKVYVNDSKAPSLSVQKLNVNKKGMLGLWVGDGSGGTFANLVVKQTIKQYIHAFKITFRFSSFYEGGRWAICFRCYN